MRTLYTKLILLVVVLLITVQQDCQVTTARYFVALMQNDAGKMTDHSPLLRTSPNDRSLNNLKNNFSFYKYFSQCIMYALEKGHKKLPEVVKCDANVNTLVTGIIKVPLPISHLSSIVACCPSFVHRFVHSDEMDADDVVCLRPGEGTIIASLPKC